MKHWNITELFEYGPGDPYIWADGHGLWDLRYFAGCRRRPQRRRLRVRRGGYVHGHGGTKEVQVRAREIEAGLRAGWRRFAAQAAKTHRAGEDLTALLEPEARTRHAALWDLD